MHIDILTVTKQVRPTSCRLEAIVSKEIPEGKLYVEDNTSTDWHRHVEQHGPKPEAYARYTLALIALEETLCLK